MRKRVRTSRGFDDLDSTRSGSRDEKHGSRCVIDHTLHRNGTFLLEARDLLTPVYEWFTEGFDTKDLMEVKTVLDELRG